MVDTRRKMRQYKGYEITMINGCKYVTYDSRHGKLESNSLKDLKKRIDGVISVNKMAKDLGKILLPR